MIKMKSRSEKEKVTGNDEKREWDEEIIAKLFHKHSQRYLMADGS